MSPKTTQVKFFCVVGAGSFSVLLLCLAPIFAWGCSSMCVGGCSVFFSFLFWGLQILVWSAGISVDSSDSLSSEDGFF